MSVSKVNWVINRRCVEPYGGGVGMDHQKKFMDIPYCIQYGRGHSVLYTGSRGNSHLAQFFKKQQLWLDMCDSHDILIAVSHCLIVDLC